MLFSTPDFVVFFVFVLTFIVLIKNRKFQHVFLLISSYFFFYYSSNYLIVLLLMSTILDFYVGQEIWKASTVFRKKILLTMSLAGNLGLLGFFKYADFAILQFNFLGNSFNLGTDIPFLNLAIPIGISFYTFQTISYTFDIYRNQLTPCKSLKEFALFVAFFPQLVAGPILRARYFLPQLREKIENLESGNKLRQIVINNAHLKMGITMMSFGFLKKMFFADNIAPMVERIFTDPIGSDSFSIILGAIGFGIQIYGDFSGYSDIAIGAALILGFKVPINFNKPYFATSPSDFWRRWHISLSTWLRDYLYIPLGGNRKSERRTYFNLMTVMFLGGLWHGASWNFVIWGVLHGVYLAGHKLILDRFPSLKGHSFFRTNIGKITAFLITQYLVFLAWIPFRVRDFDLMLYSMQKYVFLDFQTSEFMQQVIQNRVEIFIMLLFIVLQVISFSKPHLIEQISKLKLRYWGIVIAIILMVIVFSFDGHPDDFIYFRF